MRLAILTAILALTLSACEMPGEAPHDAAMTKPATKASETPATRVAAGNAAAPVFTGSPLIDQVTIGDEASEKAHAQQGENTETGDWSDRTYRHSQGGWFSWDLKVVPNQPNNLVLTYWGSDQRSFNILVDGQQLVAERIANDHPDEFFDKTYTLSPAMTKDKQKVTVRFQSPANGYAGGVFGIKIMRPTATTSSGK